MQGHLCYYDDLDKLWRFVDDHSIVENPMQRPCPECKKAYEICHTCLHEFDFRTAHDPCLGHLDEVSSACCGHGGRQTQHVLFFRDDPSWDYVMAEAWANLIEDITGYVLPTGIEEHVTWIKSHLPEGARV